MESFSGSQYGKGMESCVLPAATLAVSMTAKYTRQVRSAVLAELEQEYVAGARARGLSENRILFGNVLKSVLLRMVTLLFLSAGSLLGGTAIVETIFMWNGVGKMAVDAVSMHDIPVIQAYLVWMAAIYLLLHLIADLMMGALDRGRSWRECDEKEQKRKILFMASSPVRCCCLPRVRPIWHRTIRMSRIWNCPFFRRPRRTGWGRTAMEEICFQGFSPARGSAFFQHFLSLRQAL